MSILFKGRSQGASERKINILQRIVMFFVNHVRQALGSLGELWRQPAASLMTIGVLGLSITLPSTLYILVKNTEKISAGWEQAAEISLFLKPGTSAGSAQQLLTRLQTWSEIDRVVYIPADDALAEFQQLSGLGDAVKYLESNPLPDVVLVTPNEKHVAPTSARLLLEKLQQQREVDIGKLDIEWLERLYRFLNIATELVTIIGVLLFIAVILIVGNTIRLNILNKRDEILVMKLVGATDSFIHRPFLYTGFWYGLLGGVIAWMAVILILWWMDSSIQAFAALYDKSFRITGLTGTALFTMLGLSVLLGLVGSLISVQRHVREIEPKQLYGCARRALRDSQVNYLAHLVLSQPHADSYFGNLLGDFRRGVKVTAFSESVQAGVTNHLLVDKFTDSHPAVIAAKQQVSTQRRRFAGILLDICFDHFLLVHWQRFLATPVSQFTEHAYSNLSANLPDMPATMQRMVSSMVTDRWLDSYDDMAQLNVVLERTASRIRFKHHFHGSIEEVERHYDTFESAFLSLFPDLLQYIQHNGPEPGVAVEVLGP